MKVSENFSLQEFVPKDVYQQYGNMSIWFVDKRIITISQWLRDKLGKPVKINDWVEGGQYKESGFRNFDTGTGAKRSQHKFGRAADIKVAGYEGEELRQIVRDNFPELKLLGLTTIEKNTPTWVHIDCRYTDLSVLLEVNYK